MNNIIQHMIKEGVFDPDKVEFHCSYLRIGCDENLNLLRRDGAFQEISLSKARKIDKDDNSVFRQGDDQEGQILSLYIFTPRELMQILERYRILCSLEALNTIKEISENIEKEREHVREKE